MASANDTQVPKRVALVTGALAGIGRATAIAFAKSGYDLVVTGRRQEAGLALAMELRGFGGRAEFAKGDVREEADVARWVETAVRSFGRLDVAVNNAGFDGAFVPVVEQDTESYRTVFDTNVLGTLISMKHELRAMLAQGSGSVINLSSTMGFKGAANASVYTGSKHAVEGMTKAAALEVAAAGIRVNAVAPGPVQTEMFDRIAGDEAGRAAFLQGIPARRIGNVEEIAEMILFVASDKVPFLTGEIIRVNGGKTA
jgi:NAD(P)-dependent dehydrogenase (short-subunit alcohol dehydrogenase family)